MGELRHPYFREYGADIADASSEGRADVANRVPAGQDAQGQTPAAKLGTSMDALGLGCSCDLGLPPELWPGNATHRPWHLAWRLLLFVLAAHPPWPGLRAHLGTDVLVGSLLHAVVVLTGCEAT